MADRQDVKMEIYGALASYEQVKDLAASIVADEVKPDWDEGYILDEDEAAEYVLECAEGGDPVILVRGDTAEELLTIAESCETHGLAYRIFFEPNDVCTGLVRAWAPGFDKVFDSGNVDESGDVLVSARECEREFRKSVEAGFAFLAKHDAGNLPGVERKVTASAELLAEIRERLDADEEEEEDASPAP